MASGVILVDELVVDDVIDAEPDDGVRIEVDVLSVSAAGRSLVVTAAHA